MGRPHWRTRRDGNQAQITRELRQCGLHVYDISTVPDRQCPADILVYDPTQDIWRPYELKTGEGKATRAQMLREEFVPVVRTTEEILSHLGRMEG